MEIVVLLQCRNQTILENPEANLVKKLDQMDLLMQAGEYEGVRQLR
jgi:5'-deoxynucleotidase YfbR-like HD superfamily hydrolase